MKDYTVYTKIQQLKELGFKPSNVAAQLGIHRNTVKKYWNMDADDFQEATYVINRIKLLSDYQGIILKWLTEHPCMSASQVCDWLKEYYQASFSERTVSRYVKELRSAYSLKKHLVKRDYEAVDELPPGQQVQLDFGEMMMPKIDGGNIRVRFAAFVLAHSRYKYVQFQDRPFTAVDLVRVCYDCFQYFGGIPHELVIDQDHIMTVSENSGDIIHTYEFEKLRQECKFTVYLCRKSDPESKGKVENVVKYVKGNFLSNRYFADADILNACCLDWLSRTANGKLHGTTKKIPAEVFKSECEHLRPLTYLSSETSPSLMRIVRKDNTILYDSNRYSVPLGTYNSQGEVQIEAKDGILKIMTVFGEPICEHTISAGRGLLIKNTDHRRCKDDTISKLKEEVNELLNYEASAFLDLLHEEKARYARDQFGLLRSLCDRYGSEKVLRAISFCMSNSLYGATYVKDFLAHMELPVQEIKSNPIPVSDKKYHITTQKRSLDVYAKVGEMN